MKRSAQGDRHHHRLAASEEGGVRTALTFQWLGGEFSLIEEEGLVTGVAVVFSGQPSSMAPQIAHHPGRKIKATITGRDTLLPRVKRELRRGLAYIQCMFQLELALDRIQTEYEPETDAEREEIQMYGMSVGKQSSPLELTFDMFTRAMMVPESDDDPELVAAFAMASRRALFEGSYISCFRYAFLLFETLYGNGQFKTQALKAAFKASSEFRAAVEAAAAKKTLLARAPESDTKALLLSGADTDALIDHLVEKRGFYFHGNKKSATNWRQDRQEQADALAQFGVDIVMQIGGVAADPMFAPELEKKHFESAQIAGALIVLTVDYIYREPDQNLDRKGRTTINVPGSRPTARMAAEVAREFLHHFTHETPEASLREARCTAGPDKQEVFSLKVHIE